MPKKNNEYLSFEISSATNLRKTREILMNIWFYEDEEINEIRKTGLSLIHEFLKFALPVHWCMMLVVYLVFADICKLIDRISDFQDKITLTQLKQKLFTEWGERTTLYHYSDKIISTMKEMSALSCEKSGKYHINKHTVSNKQIVNFLLMETAITLLQTSPICAFCSHLSIV